MTRREKGQNLVSAVRVMEKMAKIKKKTKKKVIIKKLTNFKTVVLYETVEF